MNEVKSFGDVIPLKGDEEIDWEAVNQQVAEADERGAQYTTVLLVIFLVVVAAVAVYFSPVVQVPEGSQ